MQNYWEIRVLQIIARNYLENFKYQNGPAFWDKRVPKFDFLGHFSFRKLDHENLAILLQLQLELPVNIESSRLSITTNQDLDHRSTSS
jgi:hypothetical protein